MLNLFAIVLAGFLINQQVIAENISDKENAGNEIQFSLLPLVESAQSLGLLNDSDSFEINIDETHEMNDRTIAIFQTAQFLSFVLMKDVSVKAKELLRAVTTGSRYTEQILKLGIHSLKAGTPSLGGSRESVEYVIDRLATDYVNYEMGSDIIITNTNEDSEMGSGIITVDAVEDSEIQIIEEPIISDPVVTQAPNYAQFEDREKIVRVYSEDFREPTESEWEFITKDYPHLVGIKGLEIQHMRTTMGLGQIAPSNIVAIEQYMVSYPPQRQAKK